MEASSRSVNQSLYFQGIEYSLSCDEHQWSLRNGMCIVEKSRVNYLCDRSAARGKELQMLWYTFRLFLQRTNQIYYSQKVIFLQSFQSKRSKQKMPFQNGTIQSCNEWTVPFSAIKSKNPANLERSQRAYKSHFYEFVFVITWFYSNFIFELVHIHKVGSHMKQQKGK